MEDTKGKIMATSGGNQPGKEVPVARDTNTPMVPGDFHEFSGSQAKMYVTYENRQEKIAQALGSKAPLVS